ncbi:MAG: heptaprenyl diphosphate synthase component 1 [Bacillota bacterium]
MGTREQGQDVLLAVERQIEAVIHMPDLLPHLDYPEIARRRLELLNLFLQELGWEQEKRVRVCTATALAQLGLDVHESAEAVAVDAEQKRHRQVAILAGDFLSSHFYALLAEGGDIQVIAIISEAISEINQAKMRLHQSGGMGMGFPQLLQDVTVIHGALYTNFTKLDDQRGPEWKRLMERLIVTEQASMVSTKPEHAVFLHPEWERLLPIWLNDMEQLIQQVTTDDMTAARLRQRFFYVQNRFSRLTEVQR